ncbi:MAG: 6-phospho-3-hexuloisomerase [Candidatus Sulfotelmatobacter sp.]|jgi:6-phospho-3-hexuloisomerase
MKSTDAKAKPAEKIKELLRIVLRENEACASRVTGVSLQEVLNNLQRAKRIFVVGEGRSGLVGRMFAMRLTHAGKEAFVVGETTTPPIGKGDWMIAISASGETPVTCLLAESVLLNHAKLIAITAKQRSTLSKIAECTLLVPAPSKRNFANKRALGVAIKSAQFAGSLFEQQALLILDSLCLALAEAEHIDRATMWKRHANLE